MEKMDRGRLPAGEMTHKELARTRKNTKESFRERMDRKAGDIPPAVLRSSRQQPQGSHQMNAKHEARKRGAEYKHGGRRKAS